MGARCDVGAAGYVQEHGPRHIRQDGAIHTAKLPFDSLINARQDKTCKCGIMAVLCYFYALHIV